jgi:hypothetical protein
MPSTSKASTFTRIRCGAPRLEAELTDLARTFRSFFDPYHPELHYMRGPGPKWHAKHDPVPAEPPAGAALARAKA